MSKETKSFKIDFMQLNCRNMPAVASELDKVVMNSKAVIVGLQEPSFQKNKPEKLTGLHNLSHFHGNNANKTVRSAIVASRLLQCFNHPDFTGDDVSTISLKIEGQQIFVCSLYWDIQYNELPEKFLNLLQYTKLNNKPIIVLADSNAHFL